MSTLQECIDEIQRLLNVIEKKFQIKLAIIGNRVQEISVEKEEEEFWSLSVAGVTKYINNPTRSDCTLCLNVGESIQLIPAHKYFLSLRSEFFKGRFSFGQSNSSSNTEVIVVDVPFPMHFIEHSLYYIYTGHIKDTSDVDKFLEIAANGDYLGLDLKWRLRMISKFKQFSAHTLLNTENVLLSHKNVPMWLIKPYIVELKDFTALKLILKWMNGYPKDQIHEIRDLIRETIHFKSIEYSSLAQIKDEDELSVIPCDLFYNISKKEVSRLNELLEIFKCKRCKKKC